MKLNNFFKNPKTWLIIAIIIGTFLRFYKLSTVPQGMFSDEVAVGYNAYSILKTGKDEFGKTLPLFFRSFGEGKLPLYIYQAVPFVGVFGLNGWGVRSAAALFGSLTIYALYLFILESLKFSNLSKKLHLPLAILSSLSLAIMPWHIHFSRAVFGQESLFWVILGSYLLLKGLRISSKKLTFLGFLSFIFSLLIYHSPKAILPFWIPTLLFFSFLKNKFTLKQLFSKTYLGVILVIFAWGITTFNPLGMARTKGVSVFSVHSGVSAKLYESLTEEGILKRPIIFAQIMHNKIESYGREITGRYLSHFNPDFLFVSGDTLRPRYRVPGQAQVFSILLPFLIIGFYHALKNRIYLPLIFLFLAPLPAALSFETPSTVRALFMTPALAILIGLGLIKSFEFLKTKKTLLKILITAISLGLIYQFISYFNAYFYLNNIHKPYAWQYPYKPLVQTVMDLESDYDQIIVNDSEGPPYIFFLFFSKFDPAKFQQEVNQQIGDTDTFGFIHIKKFDKYIFNQTDCTYDNNYEIKTLVICRGTGPEIDSKHLIRTIYYADESIAFSIFDPKHEE